MKGRRLLSGVIVGCGKSALFDRVRVMTKLRMTGLAAQVMVRFTIPHQLEVFSMRKDLQPTHGAFRGPCR